MKMMLPDVIGHEDQSQHYQHNRCLCLDLSGRLTTPHRFLYHSGSQRLKCVNHNVLKPTPPQRPKNQIHLAGQQAQQLAKLNLDAFSAEFPTMSFSQVVRDLGVLLDSELDPLLLKWSKSIFCDF